MSNKTKKIAAILCAAALAGCLCACGNSGAPAETTAAEEAVTEAAAEAVTEAATEAAESAEPAILGSWEHIAATGSLLTDEEQEMCTKGLTDEIYSYDTLVPVCVLAEQVVAGTNYAVLCEDTYEGAEAWEINVINEDLNGNARLLSETIINPDGLFTTESAESEPVMGGFVCTAPAVDSNVLPDAVKDAPVTLTPIQQIAKQVVSGTNTMWLCRGEDQEGNAGVYAAVFYEDLQGNSSLLSCEQLDLKAYTEAAFMEPETLSAEVEEIEASASLLLAKLTANPWVREDDGIEKHYYFYEDRTGDKIDEDGPEGFTYDVSGHTLTITENDGDVESYTISFEESGSDNYLILTEDDGDSDKHMPKLD